MKLTYERLHELLRYEPDTGKFFWRVRRGSAPAGTRAGRSKVDGRLDIRIDCVRYFASRLAWLYMTGNWPTHQVDHIDVDPTNDRWANLRDVTRSVNQQNRKKASGVSGFVGVHKKYKGFVARIMVDGEMHHLGHFKTAEAARDSYVAAKRQLHPGWVEPPT